MVVALVLATVSLSAQEDSRFAVRVGVGASSVVGSDAYSSSAKLFYKVGLLYDWAFSESFSLLPAVEIANKGANVDEIEGSIDMLYIQVPIHVAYRFNLSNNLKLGINVGPYVAYGIAGSDLLWDDGSVTNVFDGDNGYDRFDIGVGLGVNLDFNKFVVGVDYTRGLEKLDPNFKQFNQTIGVVFGYKF